MERAEMRSTSEFLQSLSSLPGESQVKSLGHLILNLSKVTSQEIPSSAFLILAQRDSILREKTQPNMVDSAQ